MEEEIKSGKPEWVLLALPIFFFVWWISDLGFASIAGFGSLIFLLTYFVWIPNDQQRKLNRKERFKKANQLLPVVKKKTQSVEDNDVQENMSRAYLTFKSLVEVLEGKGTYQGIIEDKMVPSLEDCVTELTEWIGNETGDFPITPARKKELFAILTHKDELFQKWQDDGLDKTGNLTATFRSRMEMESAGININEGEEK